MKNSIARPMAAAGASVLAAVLLTGCGASSPADAGGHAPTASPSVSAAASAKAVVPASGATDSGDVAASPNTFFAGKATLKNFRITVKRTVDAQGNASLEVTAVPKVVDWSFKDAGLPGFYADRIIVDDVTVKDSKEQKLPRSSTKPGTFDVPAGSDTDVIKVSLSVEDQATTKVAGYNPSATSAPAATTENFEIKDIAITLAPDTK